MEQNLTRISKFLSLILRHQPEKLGVTLDANGWIAIDTLLDAMQKAGKGISRATLERVVAENDKKRFAISADGTSIRASQGHSIEIDLAYSPSIPPDLLFHGTATRFVESIRREGLRPGSRTHVHLSLDEKTAHAVGTRHGRPAILRVDAARMHGEGHLFYVSDNGVWLVEHVPAAYIEFPEE